ncbi:MAG: hypothetical protein H6Q90_4950 [Deltaproteobacteria bacterium]|nr:hypothetical protein [Deltaproteobacteria bacterium]
MRTAIVALAVGLGSGSFACGGGHTQIKIGAPPPKLTTGTLAGPLCQQGQCKCRTGGEDAGFPEPGRKRFEVRLGSAYDLWVTLPGRVLYKSPETAEACFYVDLAPGQHPLELRASNPTGVSLSLEVHELGTATKSWYDTFKFVCGHPGVCSFEELDTRKAEYAGVKRGLHDKCGSTRIKGVVWDHGKSPDQQYPSELAIQLTLDIYKFAPWKPHGGECGEGGGRGPKGGDAEAGEEGGEPSPATPAP